MTTTIRRLTRAAVALGAAGAGAWLLTACEPPAATFVVTTGVDGVDANIGDGICATAAGECSLRAAVQEGNTNPDAGPIRVELPGPETLYKLTIAGAGENAAATGDLDLTRPFQFAGTSGLPRISQSGDRVFDALTGAHLQVSGLDVSGILSSGEGGAIRAFDANVTVTGSKVTGSATEGGAIWSHNGQVTLISTGISKASAPRGAAIYAERVTMTRSSITTSAASNGAVVTTTGLGATSTFDASTIVGNTSNNGAIIGAAGSVAMHDSTVTGNSSVAGALLVGQTSSVGNSIVAGQVAGADCGAAVTSIGHNIESATSCGFTGTGDLQSSPTGLGSAKVVGTTVAVPPLTVPAIDSGAGCLATDQAGTARPVDGNANGTAECDRGAFEAVAQPIELTVDVLTDGVDAVPGDGLCATAAGDCTLRAAVMETNVRQTSDRIIVPSGVVLTLSVPGAGEDAAATGDLDITDDLEIRGSSEGNLLAFVDANDIDRIFDVHAGASSVILDHLFLTDGTAADGGGGLRSAAGTDVTLVTSMLFGNSTSGGGGGARVAGTITIDHSTVYGNAGGAHGGGILVDPNGMASLANSTLTTNTATSGSAITASTTATVAIVDSTLAANTGVGVERVGLVTVKGSIVSGHTAGNCTAALTTQGSNLDSGTTCGFTGVGDTQSSDPLLGSLQANGGATLNRLPSATSPAVGTNTCTSLTDQRGIGRPQGGACDKGSVEQ